MQVLCVGISTIAVFGSVVTLHAAEPQWTYKGELLRPFWLGEIVDSESVLFIKDETTGEASASVMFPIDKIQAVTNSAGDATYEEGRDYRWKLGSREITLPVGSRVTSATPADLRRPAGTQPYRLTHRDGNGEIRFGSKLEYHNMQTLITYEHAPAKWPSVLPTFEEEALPRTIAKLKAKEPLSIVMIGDSIAAGGNASGWAKEPPHQPAFPELVQRHLAAQYESDVLLTNISVGGKATDWLVTKIDEIVKPQPDLVIIAFGMNDSAGACAPIQ